MTEEFKTFSLLVDEIRLNVVEIAKRILPPEDYGAEYVGVMERQFFEDRHRPKVTNDFFNLTWRMVKVFPNYVTVQLLVGFEHTTITVDGVEVDDAIVESRSEHIEAMISEWERLAELRNRR